MLLDSASFKLRPLLFTQTKYSPDGVKYASLLLYVYRAPVSAVAGRHQPSKTAIRAALAGDIKYLTMQIRFQGYRWYDMNLINIESINLEYVTILGAQFYFSDIYKGKQHAK